MSHWSTNPEFNADLIPGLRYHRRRCAKQLRAGHKLAFTEYGFMTRSLGRRTLATLAAAEATIRSRA